MALRSPVSPPHSPTRPADPEYLLAGPLRAPVAPERPVFVADTGRRARVLRAAIRAAVVACCAWLTALVLGGVGFVGLPAMHAPLSPLARVPALRATATHGGRTTIPGVHAVPVRDRDRVRDTGGRSAKPA